MLLGLIGMQRIISLKKIEISPKNLGGGGGWQLCRTFMFCVIFHIFYAFFFAHWLRFEYKCQVTQSIEHWILEEDIWELFSTTVTRWWGQY